MMTTSEKNQINVMIINDSSYMISLLSDLLSSEHHIKIMETARDGLEALRKLRHISPDIILLDMEMPNMDGLSFIENINLWPEKNLRIIVVSNYSPSNAKLILDSLELGAVDFISIPHDESNVVEKLKGTLLSKIEVASRSNRDILIPKAISKIRPSKNTNIVTEGMASTVVVIGASTGAPRIISSILKDIPGDIRAGFLIVQHMNKEFVSTFAQRLGTISKLQVKEAVDGDKIMEGTVLLAPGDLHMMVSPSRQIALNHGPKRFGVRPAINVTMVSASEVFGASTVGVLLSGMGQDGAFGMKMIKKRCGFTLAQNESSSIVFGMAKAANDLHAVDKMVDADDLAHEIIKVVRQNV
ncbi:MAG: chemotaxis-specific protein-glutamate methyltransferase CheB [Thaumarchaeota archaeon]|nr:chemotaxis-specific protein-glutamate methyltransferase CheB [Nitrososphaerota archaeon]